MATKHYDECYFVNYDSYEDLSFYEVGCQKCPPGYSFGPIIRNNFVLHYILNGAGTLFLDNKVYAVSSKQIFVLPPNLLAYYEGDHDNPWNYIWIHFNGRKALELLHKAGISNESPVFIPTSPSTELEDCMVEILRHNNEEYICIGNLYRLFQYMINTTSNRPAVEEKDKSLTYIKDVINFITKKYSEPIKVQDIADFCGLDRSYLSKLFKHATNYTPQEYLIFFRMRKATQLLKDPNIPIQNIAYSVGYNDPFAFSKIFKKEIGVSPTQYRELNSAN
ncbi:AraC family transcriptional regulator [Lactonifactor longoviformis]|uniref:AraC-type DNA-binding protein n=1 Tax=Lactonifactor longoviformis DSM 17459 TaxID=1122155 RepID=A0A1M4XXQ0_9CLOT|nr:AraC family transcriptional regulator [Lactonifactor longoviformis]POP34994.1 AraC family transcriptional regulator [Lactonifactor longoviformis]SHE98210.1 AraC-type DNA-binding protein [Lactonifactor longoviformis DSM 17459]